MNPDYEEEDHHEENKTDFSWYAEFELDWCKCTYGQKVFVDKDESLWDARCKRWYI